MPPLIENIDITLRYRGILEIMRRVRGATTGRVLDVGGLGAFARAVPAAQVTSLNPNPEGRTGVVVGDGRNLPFADRSFDCVIFSDVLEHVPRQDRPRVLAEAARVAADLVIVSGPVGDGGFSKAYDLRYRQLFLQLLGRQEDWMDEHERFGLPSTREFTAPDQYAATRLLEQSPIALFDLIAYLDLVTATGTAGPAMERATRYFLERFLPFELHGPSYRAVWVARRGGTLSVLDGCTTHPADFADRLVAGMPLVLEATREAWQKLYYDRVHATSSQLALQALLNHVPELERERDRLRRELDATDDLARLRAQTNAVALELASLQRSRRYRIARRAWKLSSLVKHA
ncbi:MAG: class I SAM-dependent methyltransferase [Candidatus Andersenbacteria bacterium]